MKKRSDIFNVNLTYFIMMLLFVGIRILSSSGVLNSMGETASYILNAVIQIVIMLLLPLIMISLLRKRKIGQTLEDCSLKTISFKEVLISIAIGIVVFILNIILSTIISFIFSLIGYSSGSSGSAVYTEPTVANLILSLLMTAVLPAFCEEFAHRGMLLSGYKVLGFKKAVLYSALLFGLIHLNINQFFFATLVGVVLATVTLFSRSIIPAMIIHFMNNGISVYLEFSMAKKLPLGIFYSNTLNALFSSNILLTFLFMLVFIPTLIYLLLILIKQFLKINAQKSLQNYMNKMAINELRKETLGDIAQDESPELIQFNEALKNKPFSPTAMKIEIPYEILGFYMSPAMKASQTDNLFLYATIVLGSVITLFTFIWGII